MIPLFDLHTHTTYCDGNNSPEEMVRSALALGLKCIGFSGHGYAPYDTDCCMSISGAEAYRSEIASLKEKYKEKITILCGVEQDFWSETDTSSYDYVIGSVHYVKMCNELYCVDNTPEITADAVRDHFDGDWYALAETYFETVSRVVEQTHCGIIGHFDLISKFNEKRRLFDENDPRYIAAWHRALDILLPLKIPFEINTGAMARGWRTTPYPAESMIDYIRSHGGRFILSSDSHSDKTLCYAFERFSTLSESLVDDWTGIIR